jgi:hypothetical protein
MGKTKGPYKEEFPKGITVQIEDRGFLETFLTTWKFHHKLELHQLNHASKIAKVKSVGFHHGGDELYELKGVPGTWHEQCLKKAQSEDWASISRKSTGKFLWETLLYGFAIFLFLASIRWMLKLRFADSLFEVWAVSTVVFAPLVWAVKSLIVGAVKW